MKEMVQEGVDYVEIHALDETDIQRLAVRVIANMEDVWDKYLEEKEKKVPNPMVYQSESLVCNLVRIPLNEQDKYNSD